MPRAVSQKNKADLHLIIELFYRQFIYALDRERERPQTHSFFVLATTHSWFKSSNLSDKNKIETI